MKTAEEQPEEERREKESRKEERRRLYFKGHKTIQVLGAHYFWVHLTKKNRKQ